MNKNKLFEQDWDRNVGNKKIGRYIDTNIKPFLYYLKCTIYTHNYMHTICIST